LPAFLPPPDPPALPPATPCCAARCPHHRHSAGRSKRPSPDKTSLSTLSTRTDIGPTTQRLRPMSFNRFDDARPTAVTNGRGVNLINPCNWVVTKAAVDAT